MKTSYLMGMCLLTFSSLLMASENNHQFTFSSSNHGNICNQSPDVWTLGGELVVDAPITLNGQQITREIEIQPTNTIDFLTSTDNKKTIQLMDKAISCIKSEKPIELVGAVAAFYESKYFAISSSEIPSEILKPDLPIAPAIIKDQFETKAEFQARVKEISLQRQEDVNAIQTKYRQRVEARNEEIKQLQASISIKRELSGGVIVPSS